MVAIAADPPEKLELFVHKNDLAEEIVFLSDPQLKMHEELGVRVQKVHPRARTYPRKRFLQPSVFIYDQSGELRFEWRQKPKILNLWGAARRMTVEEVLHEVAELAEPSEV